MTTVSCPQGCGGVVNTEKDDWCPSCRRSLTEMEVPNSAWCWVWGGPYFYLCEWRKSSIGSEVYNSQTLGVQNETIIPEPPVSTDPLS